MKKLFLILITLSNYLIAQQTGTLINPAAINGYTTNGKVLMTKTSGSITGVPSWTNTIPYSMLTGTPTIPSTVGLLPNTTSLTINGVTQSFTSTPTFTIAPTLQDAVNQSPIVSGVLAKSSNSLNYVRITNDTLLIQNTQTSTFVPAIELTPGIFKINSENGIVITNNSNNIDIYSPSVQFNGNEIATTNQLPTITAGTNVTVSGTSPNYTISATAGTSSLTNSYIGVGNGSNALSGSSELTYSTSILKINASKTNTADVTSNLQVGSLFMGLGDVTQNNQPTFIEMYKGNGSNAARSLKGSMGFLGTTEMNVSINMDYRTGSHKYYDATLPAAWIYLGHTNGFGIQYVPANNPNSAIYATYGCIPFKVSMFNQPSTGKGIDGFSKISFAQAEFTDITNTSTLTATPCTVSLDGGILKTTSITGIETRVTGVSGHLNYQTGTSTGANMKLATGFTTPLGNPSVIGYASGTTTGYNYGGFFEALNGNRNVGVIGKAITGKANTYNIGVLGVATNTNATGPVFAGGFFGLATPDNLTITSAALIADNGSQANDILVLRDNATAVITVADGGNLTSTQNIASSSKTAGIGYAVGSGSTVTQATSRTTGVTINSITGSITLVSAAGSATWQTFTVTNSAVTAKDVIIVNQQTGTDLNMISVTNVAAGSFKISFATTGGTTTEQPVFNFSVIKGQTN